MRLIAQAPVVVAGDTVTRVALAGVVVNGATALLFMRGQRHDLNLRGAFLHMAADAAVSLAVALSGFVIASTGWHWLDPVVTLTILAVILWGTWGMLRESMLLSLHAVPAHIEPAAIDAFLAGYAGVAGVHDLHVWALSTTEVALTAHLLMPGGHPEDGWLDALAARLAREFGVHHATFQVETAHTDHGCALDGGPAPFSSRHDHHEH